jgi:hypothetical protein
LPLRGGLAASPIHKLDLAQNRLLNIIVAVKRRKKLWIVCAALAVVVALCAFALLYRTVPYKFLEGSKLDKIVLAEGDLSDGTWGAWTIRVYISNKPADIVLAAARKELDPADGWVIEEHPAVVSFRRDKTDEAINVGSVNSRKHPLTGGAGVFTRTTLQDRVLVWLHNR